MRRPRENRSQDGVRTLSMMRSGAEKSRQCWTWAGRRGSKVGGGGGEMEEIVKEREVSFQSDCGEGQHWYGESEE